MKNTDQILSPEESLTLIGETITLARNKVRENGFHFLWWGALIVISGLVDFYFEMQEGAANRHLAWSIMPFLGVPVAIIYEWKRPRSQSKGNTLNQWYGLVWLGFGITAPMLVAYSAINGASPTAPIMAITGFAVFISGVLLQFRPLKYGAIVIWAGAIACIITASTWHSFIMALCVGAGYLIPGYLLNRSKPS